MTQTPLFKPPATPPAKRPPAGARAPRDLEDLVGSNLQIRTSNAFAVTDRRLQELYSLTGAYDRRSRTAKLESVHRRMLQEYLPLVARIREEASVEELEALARTLEERMEKGMRLKPKPERDALFCRLAIEHRVTLDAAGNATEHIENALQRLQRIWEEQTY